MIDDCEVDTGLRDPELGIRGSAGRQQVRPPAVRRDVRRHVVHTQDVHALRAEIQGRADRDESCSALRSVPLKLR